MTACIAAVVVTHRSEARLEGLVQSVTRHEPDAEIVVVDSGTPGGPPATDVHVIAEAENVGFGKASNRGVSCILAQHEIDALYLLNPDVRLRGSSLTELATQLSHRPDVGIATGPVIDENGERQPSAWGPTSSLRAFWFATGWQLPRLRRLVGRLGRSGPLTSASSMTSVGIDVDGHVLGGAMVVRRDCWEELGGFDEDFFLYWEDADLCQRARNLGWKVAVLPCTPIVHIAGTSSHGVTDTQRWNWYLEGAERYASKHLTSAKHRRLLRALRLGRLIARAR